MWNRKVNIALHAQFSYNKTQVKENIRRKSKDGKKKVSFS